MRCIAIVVLAIGATASAATVQDSVDDGCSTVVVIGLSTQIADEAGCENPDSFTPFSATDGITITDDAVLPYLVRDARDDLVAVAATTPIEVNSALRTIAQQYLLYQWYLAGECGISDAAPVGESNHEGGRAVDLDNWADVIDAMSEHGWAHDVPGDDVHFDHTSSPDDRGQDVHAFQVLWNRNHPDDVIAEDGSYGPETEARLEESPADGFAIGPFCAPPIAMPDHQLASSADPDDTPSAAVGGCDAGGDRGGLALVLLAVCAGRMILRTGRRRRAP